MISAEKRAMIALRLQAHAQTLDSKTTLITTEKDPDLILSWISNDLGLSELPFKTPPGALLSTLAALIERPTCHCVKHVVGYKCSNCRQDLWLGAGWCPGCGAEVIYEPERTKCRNVAPDMSHCHAPQEFECSECGYKCSSNINYCPDCGAEVVE